MDTHKHPSSVVQKRILLWGGLLLGATLLCCVLIIVLAPKVINRDAFRTRIEAAISGTLGGTVIYDRLDLVLFPQPELKFSKLKIDIPRTGSISIDTVDIYAKLIPLLLGRFAIASVTLDRPALHLNLPSAAATSRKPSSRKSEPSGRTAGDILTFTAAAMPDLSLKVMRGKLSLKREGQPVLLLKDMESVLSFVPGQGEAPVRSGSPSADMYRITGKAQCTVSDIAALPGPLQLSIKQFDVLPGRLTVTKGQARLLDTDASFSGSVQEHLSSEPRTDIAMSGSIGPDTAAWIRAIAGLPSDLTIHAPIGITNARLRTSGTGSALSQTVTGSANAQGGTSISFALKRTDDRLSIDKFHVKDHESDAVLTLAADAESRVLSFTGNLMSGTIDRMFIFERKLIKFGWLKGDMRVRIPDNSTGETSAEGTLEGEQLNIPSVLHGAFQLDRFSIRAEGRTLLLQPVVLSLGYDVLTLQGNASFSGGGIALDLDVAADRISLRTLQELVKQDTTQGGEAKKSAQEKNLIVDGELRLRTAALIVDRYTFDDLSMVLTLGRDRTSMAVQQASICGIGLDGTLLIEDRIVDLTAHAKVRGGILEKSITCILQEDAGLAGLYDLSGSFTGRGTWESLLRSLQGSFELTSKQGRIHSKRIIKGIIAYLNSTSMFKGSRTDLLEKGFPYDAIAFRGTLKEGVMSLTEGSVRSKEVHITTDGRVDLKNGTLALNVLAAPFTSLDRLLGKIPVVKYLAGNALIVVPARVEGTFSDPEVTPLALSGVGTNITNLMKNIVQAPVKVIEPDNPEQRKKNPVAGKE